MEEGKTNEVVTARRDSDSEFNMDDIFLDRTQSPRQDDQQVFEDDIRTDFIDQMKVPFQRFGQDDRVSELSDLATENDADQEAQRLRQIEEEKKRHQEQLERVQKNMKKELTDKQQAFFKQIVSQMADLKACFADAVARYHGQFTSEKAGGTFASMKNAWSSFFANTNHQDQSACKLILEANNIDADHPAAQLNAWLNALKTSDFTDDNKVSGTSICRHLVDAIHTHETMASTLTLLNARTRAAVDKHDSLFNQHGYRPEYELPVAGMAEQKEDHNAYRRFYRDYLTAVLEQWHTHALMCSDEPELEAKASPRAPN